MNAVIAPDIDAMVDELDELYRQALDRLEVQATDVLALDDEIKRVLQRSAQNERILEWDPERAMPPHTAFRALALQIIQRASTELPSETPLLESHYSDLLTWNEEPTSAKTIRDQIAARIEFARGRSLRDFWTRLQTRIKPHDNPKASLRRAIDDFVLTIGQPVPEAILVPTFFHRESFALCLEFNRERGEMEYTVTPRQLQQIFAVGHSLATLLLLQGLHKPAIGINEALAASSNRLRANFGLYAHRDQYPGGTELLLRLHKDHVQFICTPFLFELLSKALSQPYPNVQFVDASMSDLVL